MNREPFSKGRYQAYWPWILCLIGLDYFSTLGYQPSIAFQAAGLLAPLATLVVIAATLFGALPVYAYVASRSPEGQGSIGMLERLVPGWLGKILVLVLLGFAATNFVFTRTLSAADAAVHLVHNPHPLWQSAQEFLFNAGNAARPIVTTAVGKWLTDLWNRQMVVTICLLLLGFLFWAVFRRGFTKRVVQIAVVVVISYLVLNGIVIASGLYYLRTHPDLLVAWLEKIVAGQWEIDGPPLTGSGWWTIAGVCLLLFPKMALGLSGFEMSMVVMPLVRGEPDDDPARPLGRIRNTRKLLITAALVMSVYLFGSALVTTLLIPPAEIVRGQATNRTLAYLAHGGLLAGGQGASLLNPWFGPSFGSLYDLSTVMILSLAGASVTIGLRDLVPPYLHRLGMELPWAHAVGAMLHIFNLIKLIVTVVFHADVGTQRGAYASSVLMLIASAAAAIIIDRWPKHRPAPLWAFPWYFAITTFVFLTTAVAVMVTRPGGVQLTFWTMVAIIVVSMISRIIRTSELRFGGFTFADDQSRFLWESMEHSEFPVLVPHRPGHRGLAAKEALIRHRHRLVADVAIVFIEARLSDPSEFHQSPLLLVIQEKGRFILRISRCTSIPHAIAAVGLELSKFGKPPEIHFGWSDESPLRANLNFVLFGQGNIPWMVRELLRKAQPTQSKRPQVFIG